MVWKILKNEHLEYSQYLIYNLLQVRLIGYCIEGSLFLVYEFIENGNLSQHLRGSGKNGGSQKGILKLLGHWYFQLLLIYRI